jgi:hypothetical protein
MMPRAIAAAFVLTACLLPAWAGEDSPHEQTLKQMLGALGKMTTALAGVKDGDTAQAAKPELKKAIDNWTAAKAKGDKLPPPEAAEKERLAKVYKGKMDEALKKVFAEAIRLRSIPEAKDLLADLRTIVEPPKQ